MHGLSTKPTLIAKGLKNLSAEKDNKNDDVIAKKNSMFPPPPMHMVHDLNLYERGNDLTSKIVNKVDSLF